MTAAVKVKRGATNWSITCDACEKSGWWSFGPWANAANHQTAMALARFHAEQHQRRICKCCLDVKAIPALVPVSKTHFNFDGRLYEVYADGIKEIGSAVERVTS